jgi:hypothetical protein
MQDRSRAASVKHIPSRKINLSKVQSPSIRPEQIVYQGSLRGLILNFYCYSTYRYVGNFCSCFVNVISGEG